MKKRKTHTGNWMTLTALLLALILSLTACGGDDRGTVSAGKSEIGEIQEQGVDDAALVDGKLYTDEYDPNALFHFGMVPAKCDNGKYGYININGDWVIEPQYEDAYPFFNNGTAFVAVRKRIYKMIDRDGQFVSDIEICQESLPADFSSTGVRKVLVQGEGSVYTAVLSWKDNELTVTPWEEEGKELGVFTDSGYALVTSDVGGDRGQDFGIIDSNLNYTMEYQSRYKTAGNIYGAEDHLAVYDTEEKMYCVIDMQGNVLYRLNDVREMPFFSEAGIANVDGLGIIDETGSVILSEEKFFTPTGLNPVPDVEVSFLESDWISFAVSRDYNYHDPEYLEYWNQQGENVLNCIKGRAMKNGLAAVCLEVRAGSGSGDSISVDENGTAYLTGEEDGKAWVVINEAMEIQYFLEEEGIDTLDTAYYSDGYAIAVVEDDKADAEYNYIVDSHGKRLFECDKNPELPVKSITCHDRQFTGHW